MITSLDSSSRKRIQGCVQNHFPNSGATTGLSRSTSTLQQIAVGKPTVAPAGEPWTSIQAKAVGRQPSVSVRNSRPIDDLTRPFFQAPILCQNSPTLLST